MPVDRICRSIYQDTDCLFVLGDVQKNVIPVLDRAAGTADLVYLDPPFFTNKTFPIHQKVAAKGHLGDRNYLLHQTSGFDRFPDPDAYLTFIHRLLMKSYALLKPRGSLYLHIDPRYSARVRLIADAIFGEQHFLNEIIWHYRSGGRAKHFYSRKHDTIFFYQKEGTPYFDPAAAGILRGEEKRNNMKRNVGPDGRTYHSIRTRGKEYRYYADSPRYPDDVWEDISHLQQKDPERTGYPTQKPLSLLSRIIRVSCPPGGLVADLTSGSGTTGIAAHLEGRRALLMDNDPRALSVLRHRMFQQGGGLSEIGTPYEDGRERITYRMEQKHGISLRLTGYRISGYENPYHQGDDGLVSQLEMGDLPLYAGEREDVTLLDHAAIGFLRDGVFHLRDVLVRHKEAPSLFGVMHMEEESGIPLLFTVDVFGAHCILPLA